MSVRVMIADDHTLVRRGLCALLESHPDLEVCGEAANGREAVEKAKELQPNVIIMDISLPLLNGLEATRQIRDTLPHIEVLIVTMHESSEMMRLAREAGARGYVVKSDSDRSLITALMSVCEHQPYFPTMQ